MKKVNKVIFQKGGSGSECAKISVPIKWLKEININKENPYITMYLDNQNIILENK